MKMLENSSEREDRIKFITVLYETPLGSFELDLRPVDSKTFEKLGRRHRKPVTNKKTRATEYEINLETYYPDLCGRMIREYRNLTQDVKRVICFQNVNGVDSSLVPFDLDTFVKMYRTSVPFSSFVDNIVTNFDTVYAEQIKARREKEENYEE